MTTSADPSGALGAALDNSALDDAALDQLFREARSVNAYADEPVSEEQLRAIYDLAKLGPTAMNMQPLRIVFAQSPQARERLVSHMMEGNKAKTHAAPAVAVLAYDPDFHEHLPRTFPHAPNAKDRFADETRRAAAARDNAWLQAGAFLMAVRATGLSAGPMGGFDAAGIDADLLAGTGFRSFLVVGIGKPGPDAWKARLPRLGFDEAVTVL